MSFWNPVDDIKSVAKHGEHFISGAADCTKKLAEDAYKDVATAGKTLAKVDHTALRLTEVFGEAALDAGVLKPIDGITQLASPGVEKLTGYKLPTLDLGITPDTTGLGVAGKIAKVAGAGVGFIAPVMVTGGATSALADAAIAAKTTDAAMAVKTTDAVAVKTSNAAVVENKAVSAITKFKESNWKTTVDGAVTGFALTPTAADQNGLEERLKTAAIDGATFGVMGAAAKGVTKGAEAAVGAPLPADVSLKDIIDARAVEKAAGDAAEIPLADSTKVMVAHATGRQTGAAIAGASTYAETSSILMQHHLANPDQVINTIEQYLVKSASTNSVHQARSLMPPPEMAPKL